MYSESGMDENTPIALSHLLLAGTGIYAFCQIKDQPLNFPHGTFAVISIHNILASYRWAADDNWDDMTETTFYMQLLFAMPCITTTVWLKSGYPEELCWAWTIVPVIPMLSYLCDSIHEVRLINLIVLLNVCGLGWVSYKAQNYYGVGAAAAHFFTYFTIKRWRNVLYNLGMCVFTICALETISK